MTEDQDNQHEVAGEVIKLIHGELPAVRWTCGNCGEDACTIFYDKQDRELVECQTCGASNLVIRS
jgi:NAD-dependent SIR2 family protein deacetylase